jgi:hypothetical protein
MSSAISSNRAGAASAVRLGGTGGGKSGAGGAMGAVAGNIAGTLAKELNLAVDPDGRRKPITAHDLYDIDETADALVKELGGNGADRGRVAQALQTFAQEAATLMTARPGSRAAEQIQSVIEASEAAHTSNVRSVASVIAMIDRATAALAKL